MISLDLDTTKYLGVELGAQVQMNVEAERYIVNGSFEATRLQDLLDGFIKKYVSFVIYLFIYIYKCVCVFVRIYIYIYMCVCVYVLYAHNFVNLLYIYAIFFFLYRFVLCTNCTNPEVILQHPSYFTE